MKDIHTERPKAGSIPILSPVMHCVAMTVLVYCRCNFGYAFLRPKSVFFSFSWAFLLFTIVAWNEPQLWWEYRAICIFGIGAIVLYWLHLLRTFWSDLRRHGESDHYSGRSHLLPLLKIIGVSGEKAELHLHLWIEPGAMAATGLVLRNVCQQHHLSTWLFIAAGALAVSEYLNFWSGIIRREKVAKDIAEDAQTQGEQLGGSLNSPVAPRPVRKEPVKIKRNIGQT